MNSALLELVVVTAIGSAGLLLSASLGLTRWATIWISWPMGCTLYVAAGLIGVQATGRLSPLVALVVAVAAGAGVLLVRRRERQELWAIAWRYLFISGMTATAALAANATRLTPDSLRYLVNAAGYTHPDGIGGLVGADLVKRQFALPALHALGEVTGLGYLATPGPLFGVFGVGFLCWTTTLVAHRRTPSRPTMVAVLVLFALSSNRLLYDWFYINTHIQVATYTLIGVIGTWLVARGDHRWAVVSGVCLATTLLLRPEAPFFAAAVLLAAGATLGSAKKAVTIATPSVLVTAVWYLGLLRTRAPGGATFSFTSPVWMPAAAVIGAAVLSPLMARSRPESHMRRLDMMALWGGTAFLAGAGAIRPQILSDTLVATTRNVFYDGLWLLSWPALTALTAAALLGGSGGLPHRRALTTPIIGFAILFWALPFARGAAWRIGTGDSGNRILAHIFLVVIAYLYLAWAPGPQDEATNAATTEGSDSDHSGTSPGWSGRSVPNTE